MREITFDTETTGFHHGGGDRIIEIGCVELIDRLPTGRSFHSYVNPQRDVPPGASKVSGITTDFLLDKPLFMHVVDGFLDFIEESPLVIHNASFDMGFINAELTRLCRPTIPMARAIDTVDMARKKFPGSPANLDALCRRFGIDLSSRTKHGALLDAELLAKVYLELLGGRQVAFSFTESAQENGTANDKNVVSLHKKRTFRPSRGYTSTPEELEAHEAFVKGLKGSTW